MENILQTIMQNFPDLEKIKMSITMAQHYTDIIKRRRLRVLMAIDAPLMELYYHKMVAFDLQSLWSYCKAMNLTEYFITQFSEPIQKMVNRLYVLKNRRTCKNYICCEMIFDILFDISFDISVVQTPGIEIQSLIFKS